MEAFTSSLLCRLGPRQIHAREKTLRSAPLVCPVRSPSFGVQLPSHLRVDAGRPTESTSCAHRSCKVGAGPPRDADVAASDLPDSLEESISSACSAVRTVLSSSKGDARRGKKKKGKARVIKSLKRLAVEVPVLDSSAETLMLLAGSFAEELGRGGRVSVAFAESQVAAVGKDVLDASVVTTLAETSVTRLTERLLVVAPQESDMDAFFELVDDTWRGEVVLVVNPQWGKDFQEANKQFCESFDVVYSFLPLAVQGLLGRKEGATLRWVKEKNQTALWRIFVKEKSGEFKCVGQQARRPADSELELAMYNASAAESPVTQGIKFVRNLVGGGK